MDVVVPCHCQCAPASCRDAWSNMLRASNSPTASAVASLGDQATTGYVISDHQAINPPVSRHGNLKKCHVPSPGAACFSAAKRHIGTCQPSNHELACRLILHAFPDLFPARWSILRHRRPLSLILLFCGSKRVGMASLAPVANTLLYLPSGLTPRVCLFFQPQHP